MSEYVAKTFSKEPITATELTTMGQGIASAHAELQAHADAPAPHSRHLDRGTANSDVQQVMALLLATDTRSVIPTAWNADNKPTTVEIRDGATVVGTISLTYNADNRPTQMVVTAGGRTSTYTVTWMGDRWTGTTKAVV